MRQLEPAIINVWRIKLGLAAGLSTLGTFAYDLVHLFRDEALLPFGLLTGAVLVSGSVLALGLPRLRYRFWRYALREEELYLERGILNRVRTIVPLRRIQHLDVSQDILEREFDLGKLIVHTAGTRSSEVVLPGLNMAEAERLRDTLKHYILEDAV